MKQHITKRLSYITRMGFPSEIEHATSGFFSSSCIILEIRKSIEGLGKIVQGVKYLLCKCEDLTSDSQLPQKMWVWWCVSGTLALLGKTLRQMETDVQNSLPSLPNQWVPPLWRDLASKARLKSRRDGSMIKSIECSRRPWSNSKYPHDVSWLTATPIPGDLFLLLQAPGNQSAHRKTLIAIKQINTEEKIRWRAIVEDTPHWLLSSVRVLPMDTRKYGYIDTRVSNVRLPLGL